MSISEQVKELREYAYEYWEEDTVRNVLIQAADTIEAISEKLKAENMERPTWIKEKTKDSI